jgi:ferrous iron transport protein B
LPELNDYSAVHFLINHENFPLSVSTHKAIDAIQVETKFNPTKTLYEEVLQRYQRIRNIMQQNVVVPDPLERKLFTDKLDDILLHKV